MTIHKAISKRLLVVFSAVIAVILIMHDPAHAAICKPHSDIVEQLGAKFKEKRRAFGLVNPTRMLEIFVSQKGSWTIVLTTANKMSCVVATGEAWEQWNVKFGPVT